MADDNARPVAASCLGDLREVHDLPHGLAGAEVAVQHLRHRREHRQRDAVAPAEAHHHAGGRHALRDLRQSP